MKDKDTQLLSEAYTQINEGIFDMFRKDVQDEAKIVAIKQLYAENKEELVNFLKQNINEEDAMHLDMLLNPPNEIAMNRALSALAKYLPNEWLKEV